MPEDNNDDVSKKIKRNIAVAAVSSTVVTLSGATAAFFFILWWRRRKVRGCVEGTNVEGLRVTLVGKDNLETHTDAYGEFVFKNVKEDDMLLTIYDADESILFGTEIYTKGKNVDDIFTVVNEHVKEYVFDIKGKTLEVTINM